MARANTQYTRRKTHIWLQRSVDLVVGLFAAAAILYVATIHAVAELRGPDCPAVSPLSIEALLAPCAAKVADASQ